MIYNNVVEKCFITHMVSYDIKKILFKVMIEFVEVMETDTERWFYGKPKFKSFEIYTFAI